VTSRLYAADVGDRFADLLGNVVGIALKVLIFAIIMALGWFVAGWLRRWLTRALHRIGFDRIVERGGLHRMLGSTSASDLAARLIVLAFLLFVLQLAFGIFGPNPVSDVLRAIIVWLPSLFVAVIIVVLATVVAGWVRELVAGALGGLPYGRAVATAVQVLIIVLGAIAALDQVGVATAVTLPVLIAALATVGGVVIVGVGGGLIRPMQHRWERMLNRAETETTLAAEKLRAHRSAMPPRDVNAPTGFEQPAYTTPRAEDTKTMPLPTPTDPTPPPKPPRS
jgi:hypothetical protein